MRILLFAYEFPPVLSAQALRWCYLSNELARLGMEIHVLTPKVRDIWDYKPFIHDSVTVYRSFAGPFVAFSGWVAGHGGLSTRVADTVAIKPGRIQRIAEQGYRGVRRLLDQVLFPDVRTEWMPFAWHKARMLQSKHSYDLVISSHEPGVDLLLGMWAKRRWEIPWIADLADPVVTPYTPRWRKKLDRRLECRVCQRSDEVLITTEGVKDLLEERHGQRFDHVAVIRQGYDSRGSYEGYSCADTLPRDRLVLVFTGSFYKGFREPSSLIAALSKISGVMLVVAGNTDGFAEDFRTLGDSVKLFGKLSHEECLILQHQASVLVSVGNVQDYQVPGKIYEYLGAARPILHIATGTNDSVSALLSETGRGIVVENTVEAVADAIEGLRRRWSGGFLERHFDLSEESVAEYSWAAQGQKLFTVIGKYAGATRTREL